MICTSDEGNTFYAWLVWVCYQFGVVFELIGEHHSDICTKTKTRNYDERDVEKRHSRKTTLEQFISSPVWIFWIFRRTIFGV